MDKKDQIYERLIADASPATRLRIIGELLAEGLLDRDDMPPMTEGFEGLDASDFITKQEFLDDYKRLLDQYRPLLADERQPSTNEDKAAVRSAKPWTFFISGLDEDTSKRACQLAHDLKKGHARPEFIAAKLDLIVHRPVSDRTQRAWAKEWRNYVSPD